MIPISQVLGYVGLGWGVFILAVQSIGIYKMYVFSSRMSLA
jgi:hypothetical protein